MWPILQNKSTFWHPINIIIVESTVRITSEGEGKKNSALLMNQMQLFFSVQVLCFVPQSCFFWSVSSKMRNAARCWGRVYVHGVCVCVCVRERERDGTSMKDFQHADYTLLISRQCKWNTRPHGWDEHRLEEERRAEKRECDEMRGGDRGGGGSDITAASWVKAANSIITWSHTEGAGRRSWKINTWRQCRMQTPTT